MDSNRLAFGRTGVMTFAAAGLIAPGCVFAALTPSDPFFTVTATSALGSGSVVIPLSSATFEGGPGVNLWKWQNLADIPIFDGPNLIAVLDGDPGGASTIAETARREFDFDEDMQIDLVMWAMTLQFSAIAGGADTTFQIQMPTLFFDPMSGMSGIASAGLSGTDNTGDGLAITPLFGGGAFGFESLYDGNVFRQFLASPVLAGPGASNSIADNMSEPEGSAPIPGIISSITYKYGFTVGAGDSVAGTSTFGVFPAPGSAALLGLGSLGLLRRRR